MIVSAVRAKLADRGPLGIARDAVELAFACTVIGVYELALAGGVLAGLAVALPVAAYVRLTTPGRHRCDAGCASDLVACVDAERLPKKQAERGDTEGPKPDRVGNPREGESGGAQAGDSSASPPNTAPETTFEIASRVAAEHGMRFMPLGHPFVVGTGLNAALGFCCYETRPNYICAEFRAAHEVAS